MDARWEGGYCYGATIYAPLPFRIDHILYNDRVKFKSLENARGKGLSDYDAPKAVFGVE